ncbi:hypothetical protein B0T18DRAFT_391434 [Schizothecium vesticola]|uniref:BTB domain-containing protein n=1 Tax=Schizothecium vesticola TaxID=314040 RepID=A0AA40K6E7_9PEZI|nr:hypothetical protein B0T18DRAFT_391434 [Schizothecium vesticola]
MTLSTGGNPQTAPDMSPFSSPIVEISFKDSATLSVHRAYLEDRPALHATTFPSPTGRFGVKHYVSHMTDISIDVGHVLVKWLYTGTYQPLNQGPSPQEALKTAFGVYSLSRRYKLPELEWLAAHEISRLKMQVDIASLLDIIEEVYPRTMGKDKWMESFLAQYIKDAMKNAKTAQPAPEFKADTENVPITKLIVKGLLDACGEAMRNVAAREAALAEGGSVLSPKLSMEDDEWGTPRKEKRHRVQKEVSPWFSTATAEQPASAETETTPPDNDDWVVAIERVEAEVDWIEKAPSLKTKKKKKKEPTVEPEPEPEATLPQDPEPIQEPVIEIPSGFPESPSEASPIKKEKKVKKFKEKKAKKKSLALEAEPEQLHELVQGQEPVPVPEPEMEPSPEHVAVEDDPGAFTKVKKPKKKKKKEKSIWAESEVLVGKLEEDVVIFTPVQDWDR